MLEKQLIWYFDFPDSALQSWMKYEAEITKGTVKRLEFESKMLKENSN